MKKLFWLLFSGLIPLGMLCIALYIFDPFQFYHKPYFRKTVFNFNMHYQAAGIINNYDFNSIILGSSIMVNTSSFQTNKILGQKWVNLSVSGGGIGERIDILKYALYKKKLISIIFTLEPTWLEETKKYNRYAYLYDTNFLNDFKTYLDEIFITCLFFHKICIKGEHSIDRPSQTISQKWVQKLLGGFDKWLENKNSPDIQKILQQIIEYKQTNFLTSSSKIHFPKELITIIKHHPNIQFIFIIPPFSRLHYKLNYISIQDPIKELLLLKFSNVSIYGFDNTDIPDNLSHYIDLVHYDDKINTFMLHSIKRKNYQITLDNINSYFEAMREKIKNYDIASLKKQILMIKH